MTESASHDPRARVPHYGHLVHLVPKWNLETSSEGDGTQGTNGTRPAGRWALAPPGIRRSEFQLPMAIAEIADTIPELGNVSLGLPHSSPQPGNAMRNIHDGIPQLRIAILDIHDGIPQLGIATLDIHDCIPQLGIVILDIHDCIPQLGIAILDIHDCIPQLGIAILDIPRPIPQLGIEVMRIPGHLSGLVCAKMDTHPLHPETVIESGLEDAFCWHRVSTPPGSAFPKS